ncbi:uncharacterized protein LOC107267565 isoform X2 [Cephus cinctus]|uniref:Uncharacterized protein LOC107267565 isoform X2 n=1 Tax=Cephus cinctus TaxID=211228 RepID=A0AAJ7BUY6_CEPCN|nr:uncharacterized protein LOC107267565 isoform X2 [Cephus cinctus]XP_015594950.1 uncharacterized protein LOC107267565 isoform X2 [Cephus cinctus]
MRNERVAMQTILSSTVWILLVAGASAAIVPPPWANPSSNPCAAQPRGWQLLYWPDDGKCYKIFQIGPPCPETMELGPAAGGGTVAECRCPPGTAQSPRDALCHSIFTRASCEKGQYFAPVPEAPGSASSKRRWGVCREPEPCSERGEVFWPQDGKCYPKLTRGPCPRGELLVMGDDDFAICSCSTRGELSRYHWPGVGGGCYEHYTKGPCTEPGELFLPGGICGCHSSLPHYHEPSNMCYPLGGIGPCPAGHQFVVSSQDREDFIHAKCVCKPGHVLYRNGICYRVHTRGPCDNGSMLINSTTCVPVPCKRGRLYFPQEKTCYKVGSRGPCPNGQIVLYDYNVRPSLDGISYNGVCGCTSTLMNSGTCSEDEEEKSCESTAGMAVMNKTCYKLYTQGPCAEGEWLVAQRVAKGSLWQDEDESQPRARCECRPGYKRISENSNESELESNSLIVPGGCQPPAVSLARFLNEKLKSADF